jgi:hypothetical protein
MMTSSSSAISFGPTHPSRMRASGRGESTSLGLAFSSSVRAPPQSIRSRGGRVGEGWRRMKRKGGRERRRREREEGRGKRKEGDGREGKGGEDRDYTVGREVRRSLEC